MNKIEIEIGGKLREFHFGLGFLGDLLDHLDTDISGLGKMLSNNPYKAIPSIIYFGHSYVVRRAGKIVDFTLMDVDKWVEDMPNTHANEDIEKMLIVLLESIKKNVPGMAELAEKESEKEKKS